MKTDRGGSDNSKTSSHYVSFFISLTDLPEAGIGYKRDR